MGGKISDCAFRIINYTILFALAVVTLYPLWYVLMYSLSDPNVFVQNYLYYKPTKFSLQTYMYVFKQRLIYAGVFNSIFITVVGTAINLIVIAMTAYPLSKERLRGKNIIFSYFLFTMLFSGGLVPTYLVVRSFGLIDSLWALILPGALSVYYMLIMIKFFKGIPDSLFESAKLDGAKELYILLKIVVPLSKASFAAIGLFCAVGHWNSYFDGLMFLNSPEKFPLQVVLYGMLSRSINPSATGFKDAMVTPINVKMCAVVVSLIPILLVYPFIQKHFMSGVLLGSVKG